MHTKPKPAALMGLEPLIDLHCHFEGSIDPERAFAILHGVGYEPARDRDEYLRRVRGFEPGQQAFFDAVSLLDKCLLSYEVVTELSADVVLRAAAEGVKLLELSFAPRELKLRPATGAVHAYLEALFGGIERGMAGRDIVVGPMMLFLPRHFAPPLSRLYGEPAELVRRYRDRIVSVNLCSFDLIKGQRLLLGQVRRLCEAVRAEGLHLTAHAGEFEGPPAIRRALAAGVERIGHGIRALEDPALLAELCERGVTLEVCPLSNYRTGAVGPGQVHPLPELLRRGVPVTINTDDQGVQHSSWRSEHDFAAGALGLSEAEIRRCQRTAYDACFIPEEQKRRYRSLFH